MKEKTLGWRLHLIIVGILVIFRPWNFWHVLVLENLNFSQIFLKLQSKLRDIFNVNLHKKFLRQNFRCIFFPFYYVPTLENEEKWSRHLDLQNPFLVLDLGHWIPTNEDLKLTHVQIFFIACMVYMRPHKLCHM